MESAPANVCLCVCQAYYDNDADDADVDVDVFLLVYSVTDRQSFNYVQQCLQDVSKVRRRRAGLVVVANKYDLVRNRIVSTAGPTVPFLYQSDRLYAGLFNLH